jgi:hypothetical protein
MPGLGCNPQHPLKSVCKLKLSYGSCKAQKSGVLIKLCSKACSQSWPCAQTLGEWTGLVFSQNAMWLSRLLQHSTDAEERAGEFPAQVGVWEKQRICSFPHRFLHASYTSLKSHPSSTYSMSQSPLHQEMFLTLPSPHFVLVKKWPPLTATPLPGFQSAWITSSFSSPATLFSCRSLWT